MWDYVAMLSEDAQKAIDHGDDWVQSVEVNSWITHGSTPSKDSGSWSHNMPAANSVVDSAAASRVPSAVGAEEDAEPDKKVPTNDDEDEMMYPELVDIASQQAVYDEYPEDPMSQARLYDTHNEEKDENMYNYSIMNMMIEEAEENVAPLEIEDGEENATTLELEANEEVPAPWDKRPRDEETEEFECMAFDGFEAIREEEEGILHRRLGLVRSLVLATMLQIGLHLFVTWSFPEVVFAYQDTHRVDLVSSLVIIWSITELCIHH
ncbi:very-long-chain (3R)-3-hydroxyacyl-CoA dehydratase PASTICCINO 2A [Hordeum vulgare]|nr:very-long-chain (3R)-3-hydroxyacyl-CoA dehydratase PASTICCINO 2A [Hordeum vulgare]